MNVNALIARAPELTLLTVLSLSVVVAEAQEPAPGTRPVRSDVAPAGAVASAGEETAPIEKFDLAAALMAQSGGLTSDEAAKLARGRAPQILSARATAQSSQIDVDAAWTTFVPIIDLVAQYKRVSFVDNKFSISDLIPGLPVPEPMDMGNAGAFTQPVHQYAGSIVGQWAISDVFLRAWPAYKANVGIAEAQRTQIEVAESTIELTARSAFYDYARALAQRAVTEQALKQAQAQADQIKLFVDAGTAAQVDHMTATARVEEARSAHANAQARVLITQNTLATLLGLTSADITGLAEPVLDPPVAPTTSSEDLVRRAIEQRAEARALRKLVDANDYVRKAQRGTAFPQLLVTGSDLSAKPNPRKIPYNTRSFKNTWEVGVALNWRLNNTANGTYAAHKAGAQVTRARADLAAQEDAIRMEVVNAYQSYKGAEAVTAASQARLAAAEEAYRVRLATYRVGAGVLVDLLDADLTVSQSRLALANSAINTRAALAALNRAAALDR